MGRAELGTKYACQDCGTKFYDLNRATFACPKCGTAPNEGSKETLVAKSQDEVITGVDEQDGSVNITDEDGNEDEADDVEEVSLDEDTAGQRLLEAANIGSDDDEDAEPDLDKAVAEFDNDDEDMGDDVIIASDDDQDSSGDEGDEGEED